MVVVSLTSYPTRFTHPNFLKCLESVVGQDCDECSVCLTLHTRDLGKLPDEVLKFVEKNDVEILCSNVNHKVYLKFLLAAKRYGMTHDVVTVDDDMVYDKCMVSRFLQAKESHPHCVIAGRVHQMTWDEAEIRPYKKWNRDCVDFLNEPRNDLMATGVGGVLYPVGFFNPKAIDEIVRLENECPDQDDVALTRVAMKQGFARVLTSNPCRNYTQNSGFFAVAVDGNLKSDFNSKALCIRNVKMNQNDQAIRVLKEPDEENHRCVPAVYITDLNYADLTARSVEAFSKSNPHSRIFILLSGDTLSDIDAIRTRMALPESLEVTYVDCIDYKSVIDEIKKNSRIPHVSSSAILKMYLPEVLPKDMNRVLYMDGDTMVRSNLDELASLDLGAKFAAVVRDEKIEKGGIYDCKETAGRTYAEIVESNGGYFNSGVMLLNLRKMRDEGISRKLLDFAKEHKTRFVDQDAFNLVFGGNVEWLPMNYNLMPWSCKNNPALINSCKVFHAAGPDKDFSLLKSAPVVSTPTRSVASTKFFVAPRFNGKVDFRFSDKKQKHDLVWILGTGSRMMDKELLFSIDSAVKFCKPWLRNIYVVGSNPRCNLSHYNWNYLYCDDPYRKSKDANIIEKTKKAIERIPDLSDTFLLCSDDQLVTQPCDWSDFRPTKVRDFDRNDFKFKAICSRTQRNNVWLKTLYETLEQFDDSKPIYYYQPHIWSPIEKRSFLQMCKDIPWWTTRNNIIFSLYYNYIAFENPEETSEQVFYTENRMDWSKHFKQTKRRFVSYNDQAFMSQAFINEVMAVLRMANKR